MYFTDYKSPSDMYKKLSKTENTEMNKTRADLIRIIESTPKDDVAKIEENEKIDIVERILKLNNKIQSRQGLKILIPSQMLSRLPITLAHLKARNNSEQLKNKIRLLSYFLYRSKILTKKIYNNLIITI